jgi:two-component system OmpR family response regulator
VNEKLSGQNVGSVRRCAPRDGECARVLVVEDDERSALALAALLEAEGYEIRKASSGVEAIEKIDAWIPHLVVLDINLGDHDGFQVASIIRGMRATAEVGIIATSGYNEDELRAMGCLANFDRLFQKGRDGCELVALARSLLNQQADCGS